MYHWNRKDFMKTYTLIATTAFGLESVVKYEIMDLGYTILEVADGKVTFQGDEKALVNSNLWLRCADRVLLKVGEFTALTFDALFEKTKALPWSEFITQDGCFPVDASSVRSKLYSLSDCQAIVKKAVVEKMKLNYPCETFPETGALYKIKVSLLKDKAILTIDTSGIGLHKRGYRQNAAMAPIKETLAAALVKLSFWNKERILVDPFCGSGTIPIEAALIGANIAPGLNRNFVSEKWDFIDNTLWKEARAEAFKKIDDRGQFRIFASDVDAKCIELAIENAENAGVDHLIKFSHLPFHQLQIRSQYGIIITNPPYGERIGNKSQLLGIYRNISTFKVQHPTWSLFFITGDKGFETLALGEKATKRRKLYNGRIETTYYQWLGEKPPKLTLEK